MGVGAGDGAAEELGKDGGDAGTRSERGGGGGGDEGFYKVVKDAEKKGHGPKEAPPSCKSSTYGSLGQRNVEELGRGWRLAYAKVLGHFQMTYVRIR